MDWARGRSGAIKGGRLKDAKTVIESRRANNAKLGIGTGRGGTKVDVRGPNILVNWLSLCRHKLMLTPEVATNFAGPAVVEPAGWPRTVLDTVSIVFAIAYVPKYRADTRRKGREAMKR